MVTDRADEGPFSKLRDWKGQHKPTANKLIHSTEAQTGLDIEAPGIFEGWGQGGVVRISPQG